MKVQGNFLGPPLSTDKTTLIIKVSNGAKIRNQYNQVPHLTQDSNGKITNSQLDTTKPHVHPHTMYKTHANIGLYKTT